MNVGWTYSERMQRAGFRFAALVAAAMTVAMVLIAVAKDLPIRDPDGVASAYIVLPVILLATVALDIVPRAIWRVRRTPAAIPATILAVTRERWGWKHTSYALAGLGTWYVTYATFRNLKSYVPFVNDRLWDNDLASIDRVLWLGHDPAVVLHDVLGTGWAAPFLSFVYVAWIAFVPVSLAMALVWTRRTGAGAWYVTAIAVDWALGAVVYYLVPSLGPIYSSPGDFASLPHTWVTSLENGLWADRVTVLTDPNATEKVQTIAAFASLHVGIMVTACLMAHLLHLAKPWKVIAWVCLVLTVISTIYLGWHFFVDTLGGAVLGSAAVWIAAIGTGNAVGLRPRLRERGRALDQASADRSVSA
jgi:hypothetical protein